MKKQLLFLLSIIISFNCYSQISFEKGYYIDNNNQKINCFIKNIDWANNPTGFEYKLSEKGEIKKNNIKSVKEFGIDNVSKYVRRTVNIDRSRENINNLGYEKDPVFQEETLFLKVLVEGKAVLYQYWEPDLKRYFYNKENTNIKQLVFKTYKITESNISWNNKFREQLWIDLKCPGLKVSKYEKLNYKKRDLIRFFTQYNECCHSEWINFESKPKREFFHLTVRPRLNISSLTINNFASEDFKFNTEAGFGVGVEAEFILPFNRNKWAVLLEPAYQYFKTKKTINSDIFFNEALGVDVNYSSIEVSAGLRHYFFLKDNSRIFINAYYMFDFDFNSSVDFPKFNRKLDISAKPSLALGIGYKPRGKASIELRYLFNREILNYDFSWSSSYRTFSVIFGYTLFSKNRRGNS